MNDADWHRFLESVEASSPLGAWLRAPQGEKIRGQIREWSGLLPRPVRARVFGGFRGGDLSRFLRFYNELAVGSILQRSGYQVTYEPRLGDQTPDWHIRDENGEEAIVEVASLEGNQATQARDRAIDDLVARVRAGDLANLWVSLKEFPLAASTTPEQRAAVADQLHSRIREFRGQVQDSSRLRIQVGPVEFELQRAPSDEYPQGFIFPPVHISDVNNEDVGRLLARTAQKVQTYSAAINARDLPFIVALVPSFSVQTMADGFGWAGLGDGTFFRRVDPALSGIWYCGYTGEFEWEPKAYWANPHATRLLVEVSTPIPGE